jgi:checkpoint serine/threonine-protein kinase
MTLHTKAANEDILDIFNQPLRNIGQLGADHDSASESDFDDEDYTGYTSAGDSTGTGGASAPASEFGDDDTTRSAVPAENTGLESVSPWSDFTKSKHMPKLEGLNLDDKTSDQAQDTHDNVENQTPHIQEFSEDSLDHRTQKAFSEQELEASIESQSHEDPYTKRISIPPEDYEAPTHPFRDAAQMAQNRLPFMTPIVEQTESSIPSVRPQKDYFSAKTPSRKRDVADPALPHIDDLLIGSPFKLAANEAGQGDDNSADSVKTVAVQAHSIPKSIDPIIQDRQCNPVDETIRKTILERIEPPLTTFEGFYDHSLTTFNRGAEIRKFVKAITKVKGAEKTSTSLSLPPILHFPDSGEPPYTIKRELGKGAFAPVYLASASSEPTPSLSSSISSFHTTFVAIKAELPPNPWEFYILRLAHDRLLTSMFQAHSRAAASLASPTSFHLFADEAYLLESYHDQGTLLDLANLARADAAATGAQAGACDETVAVYFAAELLRCLEALHAVGILHGDIKADNFLVRLDPVADNDWDAVYRADGTGGWSSKGIALIDFGRGVDMRAFVDGVQFIADWKTTKLDCPEMREMRPWTFQADYWGAAGVLHVLLYGKWIEDVLEKGGPAEGGDSSTDGLVGNRTKRHRLKESFKRYWQTELWGAVFDVLMNPMVWVEGEENGCLPVTRRLSEVRAICERWLEENAEKRGLKGQLKRYEERLRAGKRA